MSVEPESGEDARLDDTARVWSQGPIAAFGEFAADDGLVSRGECEVMHSGALEDW